MPHAMVLTGIVVAVTTALALALLRKRQEVKSGNNKQSEANDE